MDHRFDRQYRILARILTTIVLVGFSVLAACGPSHSAQKSGGKDADSNETSDAKDTTVKRYTLTGRVVSIDKAAHSINIDGDEIPGFMAAMTMPYQVRDAERAREAVARGADQSGNRNGRGRRISGKYRARTKGVFAETDEVN